MARISGYGAGIVVMESMVIQGAPGVAEAEEILKELDAVMLDELDAIEQELGLTIST